MHCRECNTKNDQDASFCTGCGKPISTVESSSLRSRKSYLFLLALLPVLALVAGIGYYKLFLPQGVAAVVNGEEIPLSELDAEVSRMPRPDEADAGLVRRQALLALITERLALQEARKAGFGVSGDEIVCAVAQARASSGMDGAAFQRRITAQYGGTAAYEDFLKQRLLREKFIHARVVPPGMDLQTASAAEDRWLQGLLSKAFVRISLSEQVRGPGCGCRDGTQEKTRQGRDMHGCGGATRGPAACDLERAAADAGIRYWNAKHGPGPVVAIPVDFGCHVRVDIVKNGEIIGSLRYRDGSITEI
ncbi:MAG TPA: SurA N-terminal domain-containing protein [Nitrospirota bacterium]